MNKFSLILKLVGSILSLGFVITGWVFLIRAFGDSITEYILPALFFSLAALITSSTNG